MDKKENKEIEYKLGERNLDVLNDLNFVRNILKDFDVDSEPDARGVLLDLAYTLARDQLVEAERYAKLENRSNVTLEDINKAKQVHVRKVYEPPPQDENSEPKVAPQGPTRRKSPAPKETRPTPKPIGNPFNRGAPGRNRRNEPLSNPSVMGRGVPNSGPMARGIPHSNRGAHGRIRRPEPLSNPTVMGRGVPNSGPMARGVPLSNVTAPYPVVVQPRDPSKKAHSYLVNPQTMTVVIKKEQEEVEEEK